MPYRRARLLLLYDFLEGGGSYAKILIALQYEYF